MVRFRTCIAPDARLHIQLSRLHELAHNIYSLTIDSHGRVVVAGPGYVKILHDDDGDGHADLATLFSDRPSSGETTEKN
jgi:hypothetical protein